MLTLQDLNLTRLTLVLALVGAITLVACGPADDQLRFTRIDVISSHGQVTWAGTAPSPPATGGTG